MTDSRTSTIRRAPLRLALLTATLALGCLLPAMTAAAAGAATKTSVSCTPANPVLGESVTCLAHVEDTVAAPTDPTGKVRFRALGEGRPTGKFNASTCTLIPFFGHGSFCSVSFAAIEKLTVTVSAAYEGDATHGASEGATTVVFADGIHATQLSLACPDTTGLLRPLTFICIARVTDIGPNPVTPTGSISFSSSRRGTFAPPTCTLIGFDSRNAICESIYSPSETVAQNVTANYAGDQKHSASSAVVHVEIEGT